VATDPAPQVCGGSARGLGGCQDANTKWWQAQAFCKRGGARLCTADELARDETRATG